MSELKQIKRHHERQLKNMDKKLTMYQIHPDDVSWLIKQAERYEDLLEQVKQIEKVSDYNADLRMKYEKVLEFYADSENWIPQNDDVLSEIAMDYGSKAQQALGWEEENDKHRA
jgi:hypothetical protein